MKDNKKLNSLPQRYINKKDIATLKTIEIIGREKYAELLDNNLIIQDYSTLQANKMNHKNHLSNLKKTIMTLSCFLSQTVVDEQIDYVLEDTSLKKLINKKEE